HTAHQFPFLYCGYSHDAVVHALRQCGIRHIDTAKRYGCESLLQKAIKESGVKREDLWITTKLWHSDYGYENTKKFCLLKVIFFKQSSQAESSQNFFFLLLGVCRSIGVSNFLISHLERFLLKAFFCLFKVEYHPFQRPQELVDYCRSREIVFEGYCPLAKGEALTHPSIIQLAKKYGRTPAQICIRWSIQNGIVTIPKSTRAERIQENCKVRFGYALKNN
uniref:NADP-dependent oxidoreductase domain-containing protein n=1 Tax=Phasianus colchicus TaxID=9054 RepID=A0A669R013_PHACC